MPIAYSRTVRRARGRRRGFTLLELLTVIGIIGLLIALLTPAVSQARRKSRSVACMSQLRGLMTAIHLYAAENADTVVPSYNMTGVAVGQNNPLDGWGPILHKGRFAAGNRDLRGNIFVCPDTAPVAGMATGNTGTSPDNPRGYMEWPSIITLASLYATPLPQRGFDQVIRVGYWINGDNPIGRPERFVQGVHFTGSVGYGPDPTGRIMRHNRMSDFKKPSQLIALSDGLYSGGQQLTRLGDRDSRIGYRHPGVVATANVGLADGHATAIAGDEFPRKLDGSLDPAVVRRENLGPGPTLYSDPERFLNP
ncbi:MAG: prepilin-type N-terminal cleavage/methylation domain-containing protein [Phycisphaerae bacterium]|nr:prepilin-type N-terminal cleavage/methylation domain-containing protein [Phycisphaerae bacterium]